MEEENERKRQDELERKRKLQFEEEKKMRELENQKQRQLEAEQRRQEAIRMENMKKTEQVMPIHLLPLYQRMLNIEKFT